VYTEDELLPISALQHLLFCRRRAALVHIEGLWAENRYTTEGHHLHNRVHDSRVKETRNGTRQVRGVELRSFRWGLTGKADLLEVREPEKRGVQRFTLVEYKRGRPKPALDLAFHVQLCAQAMCVEEMLDVELAEAAIYFGKIRQRRTVVLDETLRNSTAAAIDDLHRIIRSKVTPTARFERKCRKCSLVNLCLPKALKPQATALHYLDNLIENDS